MGNPGSVRNGSKVQAPDSTFFPNLTCLRKQTCREQNMLHVYCTPTTKANLLTEPSLRKPQKEVKKLKTLEYSNPASLEITRTASMSTLSCKEQSHITPNSLSVI